MRQAIQDPNHRRKEGFRVIFRTPMPGTFSIKQIGGKNIESSTGEICVHDLSLGGAKISTVYDLPADQQLLLTIGFKLVDSALSMEAEIAWKEAHEDQFYYGLKLDAASFSRKGLFDELKKFVNEQDEI